MAKMTNLELLNGILVNIGEPQVASLTSLSGIQLVAWNKLNEALVEVAHMGNWLPLEGTASFTMSTASNYYAVATDMENEDVLSFTIPSNNSNLSYLTPIEWRLAYPNGVGTATTGWPTHMMRENGNFYVNKYPSTSQHGSAIHYRYWKLPTALTTATTTTTCWFPEGFDRTVLINLATYKTMMYKNSPEATFYYQIVYGQTAPTNKAQMGIYADSIYGKGGELAGMVSKHMIPTARFKPMVTYHF